MSDTLPVRVEVLREAERLTTTERAAQYGPPSENFSRIAGYWNHYLRDHPLPLQPSDIAMMMVFLKIAREAQGFKLDSSVDACGYMAIYAELASDQ